MCQSNQVGPWKRIKRRSLLLLGGLAILYPFLRFIGYSVPKKPKRVEINRPLPTTGLLLTHDFILFERDGKAWAVSRKCTHLGCKLNYHEQAHLLECPCHQSQFSVSGKVIQGPAKRNLAVYQVDKQETAPYYVVTI